MLALLGAVFGFLGPFLPEVLKFMNRREDNRHELQVMNLQIQAAEKAHTYKMAEIESRADIAEMQTLRQPAKSFGVSLMDAAKDMGWHPAWLAPAFYLFVILDFLAGAVRPVITFGFAGFYLLYKHAQFATIRSLVSADTPWEKSLLDIWTEQDFAMLAMVLSYWFGNRVAKHAFGWQRK